MNYRKNLRILTREHKTDDFVRQQINTYMYADIQEPPLAIVKRRKLAWYAHVSCYDSLSKTILRRTVEGSSREEFMV